MDSPVDVGLRLIPILTAKLPLMKRDLFPMRKRDSKCTDFLGIIDDWTIPVAEESFRHVWTLLINIFKEKT
jgi:hypothetical protein